MRFLYCKKCGWSVTIADEACVNACQQCHERGLSLMEFGENEWDVLSKWFAELHGVTIDGPNEFKLVTVEAVSSPERGCEIKLDEKSSKP